MKSNHKFRKFGSLDYINVAMIIYVWFQLAKMGWGAFLCGGVILFASLSIGNIFTNKENKEPVQDEQ